MVKEYELRKAIEAIEAIEAASNVIENKNDIQKLIYDKYTALITEAINSASKHIDATKSLNPFSHTLKVLFDKAQSKEGLNK